MEKLLITNARVIDPSCQPAMDFVGDILIEEERIAKVGAHLKDSPIAQGAKLLDAGGLCAGSRAFWTSMSICVTRDLPIRRTS